MSVGLPKGVAHAYRMVVNTGRSRPVPVSVAIVATLVILNACAGSQPSRAPARIQLPAPPRSVLPWTMAGTGHVIWLSVGESDADARLMRIDTDTGSVRTVGGAKGAMSVAAGEGAVWVSICDGPTYCTGSPTRRARPGTRANAKE